MKRKWEEKKSESHSTIENPFYNTYVYFLTCYRRIYLDFLIKFTGKANRIQLSVIWINCYLLFRNIYIWNTKVKGKLFYWCMVCFMPRIFFIQRFILHLVNLWYIRILLEFFKIQKLLNFLAHDRSKDWTELKLEFQLKVLTHNMESLIDIPLHILNLALFRFNLSMIIFTLSYSDSWTKRR